MNSLYTAVSDLDYSQNDGTRLEMCDLHNHTYIVEDGCDDCHVMPCKRPGCGYQRFEHDEYWRGPQPFAPAGLCEFAATDDDVQWADDPDDEWTPDQIDWE